jgi:hypothetical protein
MSPEANLLRLAYIDINALLVEGFDTNAQHLVDMCRANELEEVYSKDYILYAVANTLTEIRDLFGADDIKTQYKERKQKEVK